MLNLPKKHYFLFFLKIQLSFLEKLIMILKYIQRR